MPLELVKPQNPVDAEGNGDSSKYGEIMFRGWLNLKIRSMVNVRPRHMRYCVLSKDTHVLSTFKFQPSHGDLSSGFVKPLRAYKVTGVSPWNGRKFAFLLQVVQCVDDVERVLEVDAPLAQLAEEWIYHVRVLTHEIEEDPQKRNISTVSSSSSTTSPNGSTSGQGQFSQQQQQQQQSPQKHDKSKSSSTFKKPDMWIMGHSIHRGLLNDAGENNCFLNVVIQSFWHLLPMRQFLLNVQIKDESRTVEANVLRALRTIMLEYDDTSSGTLNSRALRKGLSVLYKADKNFEEGEMYDAEETLLALLNLMHQQTDATDSTGTKLTMNTVKSFVRVVSNEYYEETPQAVFDENSIPHLVFSHQIYDRFICNTCRHVTSWDLYSNLVFTCYATDIFNQRVDNMEMLFQQVSATNEENVTCDYQGCKGKNLKERVIRRFPMVFAISVLWATNTATSDQVERVLTNIKDRLNLARAFRADGPASKFANGGLRTQYRLRGFVCYYGKHYVAFFYSTAHRIWLLFDDIRVLEIGSWDIVVKECLKGKYQPVLLFYELPDVRKDSSVGLDFVSERLKSMSYNSSSEILSIKESDDEGGLLSPPPAPQQALSFVAENGSPTQTASASGSLSSSNSPAKPADQPLAESQSTAREIIQLESDATIEQAELTRQQPSQNIVPVSSAIAMRPRTITMNSPCKDDEYDVMFGGESVVLGMYLEKIEGDLCVTSFPRGVNGELFGAERSGKIDLFDTVMQANGHPLQHYPVDRALKVIKAQVRPLVLRFKRSTRITQLMEMGFSKEKAIEALIKNNGDVRAAVNSCL